MSDRLALAHAFVEGSAATKADVQGAEARLKAAIAEVNARIDLVEHRLLTRLGGLMVVGFGALFAALHYWPPHG
jgi:hypothetical protein